MKTARIVITMLIFAGMASFNPAEAQFKKLRNKAKDKIEQKAKEKQREKERKLEAKVDKKLDEAVEGAEDGAQDAVGSIFERKAEEMMADIMGAAEEPFDLGPNETGNANAPYVYYRSVSKMEFAGMAEMPEMFAGLMSVNEVHYIHDGIHRTDSRGTSTIVDANDRKMVNVNHEKETFSVRTFDDMAAMLESMSDEAGDMDENDVSPTGEMKVSVQETGKSMKVNNVLSDQRIMILEGEYEASSNRGSQEGNFYLVIDAWISEAVAGYATISDTNQEIAEGMGSAFGNSSNPFLGLFAMMQNEEASGPVGEALAEMKKMGGGLPVKSTTYMVQAPKGAELDLDKVLSGDIGEITDKGEVKSQQTVFIIRSDIGDLTTSGFGNEMLAAPASYTEIEYSDPWKAMGR